VERFLRELCIGFLDCVRGGIGVEKRELEPSVPVLVRNQEAMVLRESEGSDAVKQAFWRWGFGMKLVDDEGMGEGEYAQVFFECLPEVVADKVLFLMRHMLPPVTDTFPFSSYSQTRLKTSRNSRAHTSHGSSSRETPFRI
jgi:hypothetical protein